MQQNKVEFAFIVGDGMAKGGTDFVIHDVDGGGLIGGLKACMKCLVGSDAMGILLGGKGLYNDSIAALEGNMTYWLSL